MVEVAENLPVEQQLSIYQAEGIRPSALPGETLQSPHLDIEMVNHAGLLFTRGNTGLLVDPWLTGSAFESGWDLLSPTSFGESDWGRVTHIWISHEHPDHFSVPSLRSIPEADRDRIEVLFQRTEDQRVLAFCQRLFKAVTEIGPEPVDIGDLRISCTNHTFGDSYLWVEAGDMLVLNTNDCVFENEDDLTRLLRSLPKAPDVLCTQFSYANWCGNPDDPTSRLAYADGVAQAVLAQIEVLQPTFVVPFASFIWHSHEENSYMNTTANDVGDIAAMISTDTGSLPIVLYPGESWAPAESRSAEANNVAIESYRSDVAAWVERGPKHRTETVPLETLLEHAEQWHASLRDVLGRSSRAFEVTGYLRPVALWVEDHAVAIEITVSSLKINKGSTDGACHLAATSDALDACFRQPYGGMTLGVNGRFRTPKPEGHQLVMRFFHIAWLESQSKSPVREVAAIAWRRVVGKAQGALRSGSQILKPARRAG